MLEEKKNNKVDEFRWSDMFLHAAPTELIKCKKSLLVLLALRSDGAVKNNSANGLILLKYQITRPGIHNCP